MSDDFLAWSHELEAGRKLDELTGLREIKEELAAFRRGLSVEEYEAERRAERREK